MSNVDQIYTTLDQDRELSTAIGKFKNKPYALQQFLQSQQDKVFKDVTIQKDSAFKKVYGDLSYTTKAQKSNIMDKKQNLEISKLNKKVYETHKKNADDIVQEKDLTNRKYEMNEWTVNNKKDTLFVYSMLFIMLSGLLLITGLLKLHLISTSFWVLLSIPMILIFTITVVHRSQYTDVFRNKRYWNRKIFEGKYGKIPIPLCPSGMESGMESGMKSGMESGLSSLYNNASSMVQDASNEAQSLYQDASNEAQSSYQDASNEAQSLYQGAANKF